MSRINEKLGLRPAGQRAMMRLPEDRAVRCALTATRCPTCGQTGARQSVKDPRLAWCPWDATTWRFLDEEVTT
jgi:hypothetical protein